MCNLYGNTKSHEEMRRLFEVAPDHSHIGDQPPLNAIFPKHEAPIVAVGKDGNRALVRASWGFLTPNKSTKTGAWLKPRAWNNTRDDKVQTSGLWKGAFGARRCLIPANAYAETTGRNPATYHWFSVADAEAFALAGIWQRRKGTVGDTEVDGMFFSMMTTTPNDFASRYHNRMPVILKPDDYDTWLRGDADTAGKLLKPFDGRLKVVAEGEGMNRLPD